MNLPTANQISKDIKQKLLRLAKAFYRKEANFDTLLEDSTTSVAHLVDDLVLIIARLEETKNTSKGN